MLPFYNQPISYPSFYQPKSETTFLDQLLHKFVCLLKVEIGLKLVGDTVRRDGALGLVDVEEKWMFLRKQVRVHGGGGG